MFFSEARLAQARRKQRIRRWMWPLMGGLGVLAVVLVTLAWLFTTASGLAFMIERSTQGAPFDIALDSIELHPSQTRVQTDRWRIVLHRLMITPHDRDRANIAVRRIELDAPSLRDILQIGEVDLGHVDIEGLAIHTSRQRPPPEFTPRKTFIRAVRARQLTVREASYRAEADPPLGLAEMTDITGTFERVVWSPGSKEVSATGRLEASSFQTGNLRMDQVVIPNVVARRSDLSIDNGTFVYGEGRGTLGGEVKHFHTGADSRFDVSIENARAEHIVQAATGRPSPLFATVSGTLTVHSGGDRPRGSAWMDARLRLTRGIVPIDDVQKPIVNLLLQRAPFVQFDEQGRMRLWDIEGSIRIDRGTILIHQLEYSTPRRILRVWGDLRPDQAEVVLRFVPVRAESTRAGVGMVAFRSPTDERYRFRLARPEELLPSLNANETLGGSVRRRLQQADQ